MYSKSIWRVLVSAIFLTITICIYIPIAEFVGNIAEFKVRLLDAILHILVPALIVFLACNLLGWLIRRKQRLSEIYIDLLFGFTLGVYLQFNFLNLGLKQLNGTEINWEYTSKESILSIIVWVLCLGSPHIIRKVSNQLERRITLWGSAALSIMQMVSLVSLLLLPSEALPNDYVLTKSKEFELSSKRNTVVFVVDTLDAQWAEEYIINNSQYEQLLDNFTYFNNVVSGGAPTMLGIPSLLTGELYDTSINPWKYIDQANHGSTLFSDLKREQLSVKLYTNLTYLGGSDFANIDNASSEVSYSISNSFQFTKDIYKLTAFVGAPYPMKQWFLMYSGDLTNNVTINDSNEDNYLLDDPHFYQDYLSQGISLTDEDGVFVLYHLFGAHGPYCMNENAEKANEEKTSREQQIQGVMKIISEYVEEMKEKDIYDCSTIIITADHGGVALYQNPAVFIKKANDLHPFRINSAPLTFKNLRATFVEDYISNYQETYGDGMFDVKEDANVPYRQHTYDAILHMNLFPEQNTAGKGFLMCSIGNPARDNEIILFGGKETNDYRLNDIIYFYGENAQNGFVLHGFSSIETENRWTNATEAIIPLQIIGEYDDLSFSMDYKTFNGGQPVKLYVNDYLVMDTILKGGSLEAVTIPKEYVKDGKLELKFYLPNAVSPKELGINEDNREIALSIKSIILSSKK